MIASLFALLASACGLGSSGSRYALKVHPGSRYGFEYVMDRQSRLWVHLHCELRVAEARPLPELLHSEEHGDLLSFTYFTPRSMGSAGIVPTENVLRDGHRTWLWRVPAGRDEFEGNSGLSVQARWPPETQGPAGFDTMEVFHLPRLEGLVPYVWSPWRVADELRGGLFAGWEKLQGDGARTSPEGTPLPPERASAPPFPYELRCRTVLADYVYVPIEAEDPNVRRPDPSAAAGSDPSR
jgi:hypothetical protein